MNTEKHLIFKEKIPFSELNLSKAKEIIQQYPEEKSKSALIALLQLAQEERGWLSVGTMDYIADLLHIQPIEVYEVATFYTMFHLQPVGKHVLEVCRTGPCMLVGSDQIIQYLEHKLEIKVGETTQDGLFTLKTVECLGACGYGPMLQCKGQNHEFLSEEKIDHLIDSLTKSSLT